MPKFEIELTPEEAQIVRGFLPANPNKMRGRFRPEDKAAAVATVWKMVNALDAVAHRGTVANGQRLEVTE